MDTLWSRLTVSIALQAIAVGPALGQPAPAPAPTENPVTIEVTIGPTPQEDRDKAPNTLLPRDRLHVSFPGSEHPPAVLNTLANYELRKVSTNTLIPLSLVRAATPELAADNVSTVDLYGEIDTSEELELTIKNLRGGLVKHTIDIGRTAATAVLTATDPTRRNQFDYPTFIRVKLPRAYEGTKLLQPTAYRIADVAAPGREIPIERIGLRDYKERPSDEVDLYGRFVAEEGRYELRIALGDGESDSYGPVPIQLDKSFTENRAEQTDFLRVLGFMRRNSDFKLDVRPVALTENEAAFDFRVAFSNPLSKTFLGGTSSIQVEGEGTVSTAPDDPDVQNGMSLNGAWSVLWTYEGANFTRQDGTIQPLVNAVGLRIKPVDFEVSQDFDLVNYTIKPQLTFSVPFTDFPVLWWHEAMGVDRYFLPLTLFAGYAYVLEGRDRVDEQDEENTNRLDGELVYNIPLLQDVDVKIRGRLFLDLEAGSTKGLMEITTAYYIDKRHTTAVFLKYLDGKLPPTYQGDNSLTVGVGVDF